MVRERAYDAERRAMTVSKERLEASIGRKLKPKEYVYHKDGDVFNTMLENLELIAPEDPRSVYYDDGKGDRHSFGTEVYP